MIIRRIRREEYKRVQELMSLAFEFPFDSEKPAEEFARERMENPTMKLDEQPECTWGAFEDDDTSMVSSVCSIPFTVRFDGHDVSMFGIGGVNTLPTHRRGGCVREIFKQALPAMYADGGVFSYLYPFSTAYYHQFGYERCCERKLWTVRPEAIPKWDIGGSARLVEAGGAFEGDFRRIYAVWADGYNMMTKEENAYDFGWVRSPKPYKTREYTYIYRSRDGEPKGYVTLVPKNDTPERMLQCLRFNFTDVEGFKGLLSLIKGFAADHDEASFMLPSDIDWLPLLPEISFDNVKCEVKSHGMARVINVVRALELARTRGEGELVLQISDKQIPENEGRFLVEYSGGRVTSAARTEREPDAEMGIGDFSRLIIGRHETSALKYIDGVKLRCPPERLSGLFYEKPIYICKHF